MNRNSYLLTMILLLVLLGIVIIDSEQKQRAIQTQNNIRGLQPDSYEDYVPPRVRSVYEAHNYSDEEIRIMREKASFEGNLIRTPGRVVPSYQEQFNEQIEEYIEDNLEELLENR